jgi:hypothetical protein
MISSRNVDSDLNYVRLESYSGLSRRVLKKSRHENMEEAISDVVRDVPGGEFLMNAKMYLIRGKYFAVEGDVWGTERNEMKGFATGDRVQWKVLTVRKVGRIAGLVDDEHCMVICDGNERAERVRYDQIVKLD